MISICDQIRNERLSLGSGAAIAIDLITGADRLDKRG
jgi:hypothetical protein